MGAGLRAALWHTAHGDGRYDGPWDRRVIGNRCPGGKANQKELDDAVFVYILPPSIEALRVRLEQRGSDSAEEIQRRLQKVREEMWSYREYDYIVKNDDMTQALAGLEAIVLAERIKTKRLDLQWLEENFLRDKELHSRSGEDLSQ